jgi:N utilization substance protein B
MGGGEEGEGNDGRRGAGSLSVARLAAVQALYQMDVAQTDLNAVIEEFLQHRFRENDRDGLIGANPHLFEEIVRGVVARQREIDPMLDGELAVGWRLKRIDSTVRAILRAGAFELIARLETPAAVVLNEYIDVAHAFYEGDEPKFVNGVLHKVAERARVPKP